MELPLDDHGVDHGAEVVDRRVFYDLDHPGLRIELHFADVTTVGIGGSAWSFADVTHVQARWGPVRQVAAAVPQFCGELHYSDRAIGAGNDEPALGKFDVGRRRF